MFAWRGSRGCSYGDIILKNDDFRQDGYGIARQVFSPTEIEALRVAMSGIRAQALATNRREISPEYPALVMPSGDALSFPQLRHADYVFLDRRVVEIARQILGPSLVYHGDSSVQMGEGPRGFHKDNADRTDPDGVDWQGPYGLIRIGIYLQDHVHHSGGLKVRHGSHRIVSHHGGRARNLDIRAGDVVAWYLTTTHSGNALRPRFLSWLTLHPRLEAKMPRSLCIPEQTERMALFGTLAAPGAHLERYIEYQSLRKDMQKHWANCAWSPDVRELAQRRGVALRLPSGVTTPRDLEPVRAIACQRER